MIEVKESLVGNISQEIDIKGNVNKAVEIIPPALQEKNTIPTEQLQEIMPDEGYNGLSKVNVNPIPSEYIIPTGTLNIDADGQYNVANYEIANVQTNGADLSEYFVTEINENTSSSNTIDPLIKMADINVANNVTSLNSMFKNNTYPIIPKVICNNNVTDVSNMYYSAANAKEIDVSGLNTSNVTTMESMFQSCTALQSLNFDNKITDKTTSLRYMFQYCSNLETLTLNNSNTTNITTLQGAFRGLSKLKRLDLSSFYTPNLLILSQAFRDCTALEYLDIRNMTFSSVSGTGISSIFYNMKKDCLVIVKSQTEKEWVLGKQSDLTNVKTVNEYEGQ